MSKLKKYTSFESMKSDVKSAKTISEKSNKLLLEYEAFLSSLQRQFSNHQLKENHGK